MCYKEKYVDYLRRSNSLTWALKSEELSPARDKRHSKRASQSDLSVRRSQSFYWLWDGEGHVMEGALCQDQKEPLEAKDGPQLTAIKEAQSYNHKEVDLINNRTCLKAVMKTRCSPNK